MVKEVLEYLNPSPGKTYVDCTLGGGGHAKEILSRLSTQPPNHLSTLIAIDQDADAIEAAKKRLQGYDKIEYIHDNFSSLKKHLKQKVDGFLFDLGVSSYQIDEPGRGFSLQQPGPLDMRMDQSAGLTAADIINNYSAGELEQIIKDFSEERFAGRISRAICAARPLTTTTELKTVIEKAIPTWRKRESVTRVFQALRIAVNNELTNLASALKAALELLKPGGRLVVLSYHSLEDRITKHAFRDANQAGILKIMTKKPVLASQEEIAGNPRARSAKLRAGERL